MSNTLSEMTERLHQWFAGDPEMRYAEISAGQDYRWCVQLQQITVKQGDIQVAHEEATTLEEAIHAALDSVEE